MHIAAHRQVVAARRQILADGQHVDVVRAHVAHDLEDLLVRLAQADHQAALGRDVRHLFLEALEQRQAELVVGARARFLVQARHGLHVVVHDVGRRVLQDRQRLVQAAAEVGHQHLDLRLRRGLAGGADALGIVAGAAVAQVVAVDRGDDDVLQLECRDRLGQVGRLVHVQRIRAAVADVAERAAPGALVTHDHEGRGALAEAFADVRAARLLADGVQLVLAQDLLDLVEARGRAAGLDADPVGLLQRLGRHDLDRDARGLGLGLLLGGRVVVRAGLRGVGDVVGRHDASRIPMGMERRRSGWAEGVVAGGRRRPQRLSRRAR